MFLEPQKRAHSPLLAAGSFNIYCNSQKLYNNYFGVGELKDNLSPQLFCYNVKTFYLAKSHDKTLCQGFYQAKSPYNPFSQAIMHENKSGF